MFKMFFSGSVCGHGCPDWIPVQGHRIRTKSNQFWTKKSDRAEVLKKATEDKFPHLASSHSILYSNDLTANQNSTSNLAELESIIISAQANRDTRILDDSSFDINSNIGEFPNFVTQNRPELTGNDLLNENFQNHLSENPFQTVKPSQSIHS